jgi:palmitoyltransferase
MLMHLWRWVVVALVVFLVGSITGCGVITLLPLICTTWATYLPNMAFALLLLFQIVWNYAAAVLRPAGRVSDFVSLPVRTPGGSVLQGGLQHWSWCLHCQAAKPPQAHHCNSCGTCVYAMDHRK